MIRCVATQSRLVRTSAASWDRLRTQYIGISRPGVVELGRGEWRSSLSGTGLSERTFTSSRHVAAARVTTGERSSGGGGKVVVGGVAVVLIAAATAGYLTWGKDHNQPVPSSDGSFYRSGAASPSGFSPSLPSTQLPSSPPLPSRLSTSAPSFSTYSGQQTLSLVPRPSARDELAERQLALKAELEELRKLKRDKFVDLKKKEAKAELKILSKSIAALDKP